MERKKTEKDYELGGGRGARGKRGEEEKIR